MTHPNVSIVIPVYKAEFVIDKLINKIIESIENSISNYEIILVEDFSPDQSWEVIENLGKKNPRIKGIKFSRNFGQHNAIAAGLEIASGDYAIIMDCDLQDNPKYIPDLVSKSNEGFDIVFTVKEKRKHNFFRDISAELFNRIFNYLVGNKDIYSDGLIGSYSLITRKVIDAYCSYKDIYKPYLVVLQWVGFSKGYLQIEHEQRKTGKSSYTFAKLVAHAMNGIISQTDRLLKISIYIGFLFAGLGFFSAIMLIIRYFISGFQEGWLSIFVSILFSTGLILMGLGVMGLYIGKMFEQMKGRPNYIIDEKMNF